MCSRALVTGPGQSKKRCQRSLPSGRRKPCCCSAHNAEHSQQSLLSLLVQRLRADVSGVVLRREPLSFEQPVLEHVLVLQILVARWRARQQPALCNMDLAASLSVFTTIPYLCSGPDVAQNLLEHVLDSEAPACAAADGVEFALGRGERHNLLADTPRLDRARSDLDRTRGR